MKHWGRNFDFELLIKVKGTSKSQDLFFHLSHQSFVKTFFKSSFIVTFYSKRFVQYLDR